MKRETAANNSDNIGSTDVGIIDFHITRCRSDVTTILFTLRSFFSIKNFDSLNKNQRILLTYSECHNLIYHKAHHRFLYILSHYV